MSVIKYPPITTITIGIKAKDGILLASEKVYSYGDDLIISKKARKVYPLTKNIGIAFAGISADISVLTNYMRAQINLLQLETNRSIVTRAVAKLLSRILSSTKFSPYLTLSIIGGIDESGMHLYELDIWGSVIEHEKYVAIGYGSDSALGILESNVTEELTLKDAKKVAIDAVKFGSKRTAATGFGVDILEITPSEGTVMSFYDF